MSVFPALISRYNSMEKTSNSVLVHGEEKTYEKPIKNNMFHGQQTASSFSDLLFVVSIRITTLTRTYRQYSTL